MAGWTPENIVTLTGMILVFLGSVVVALIQRGKKVEAGDEAKPPPIPVGTADEVWRELVAEIRADRDALEKKVHSLHEELEKFRNNRKE